LNVKKEYLKKKTLNPEILNKPIRTDDHIKNDINFTNFLEVETNYKEKKSILNCCKNIIKKCKKKKKTSTLLDSK